MQKVLFFFLFLLSFSAFSAQEALISSTKAIVYADEDLSTPLGYVMRGKKVVIGSQALKRGTLYSMVLNGKIAFIQTKDLSLLSTNDKEKKVTEHNVEILEKPESEIFSLNNYLSVGVGKMDMGSEWSEAAKEIDPENTDNSMSLYRILFEHHDKRFLLNYSVGFNVMGKEQNQLKFSSWGFEGNLHLSPVRTEIITLDFFLGLGFSPSVNVNNPLALQQEKTGSMYGYQYGALARLFPYSKWGVLAGLMTSSYSLKIDPIITQQESEIADDPVYEKKVSKIGGSALFLGVSYQF